MAVDDRIRLNIRQRPEPLIGVEEADALVNHSLSPTLEDLATKADLALLREEMHTMEERLRGEMRELIIGQTRWIVGFVMGWSGVVLALASWLFR